MDLDLYARFLLALVFVLALIGGLTWAARRFGLGGKLIPNKDGARRLEVVEVVTLDARRKLVLLRRDRMEHLVLLGSTNDLLLEAKIPAQAQGQDRTQAAKDVPLNTDRTTTGPEPAQ